MLKGLSLKKQLLKIISLIFAIILWFYVLGSSPILVDKKIPIKFINPPGLAVGNIVPSEISVKLRGARGFMRRNTLYEGPIIIDLNHYPHSETRNFDVFINIDDVPVTFGIDVVSIFPDQIEINLEREIKKKVPVKAVFADGPSAEYRLIKEYVRPGTIMIKGPIESMRKIARVKTTPISLVGYTGDGKLDVQFAPLDQRVSIVDKKGDYRLHFSIRPQKANMTLKKVKIRFLTSRRYYRVAARHVALQVLAPDSVKQRDLERMAYVIADVPEGKKGEVRVRLEAKLPDGIHLLKIIPEYIKVIIK